MKNSAPTRIILRNRLHAQKPKGWERHIETLELLRQDEILLKTDSPENRVRRQREIDAQLDHIVRAVEL